MSVHPSLKSSDKTKKQRSVLKRTERLRTMMEKGNWKEGDSVFGLPKIKTIRIKIKKEKAAEKPEEAGVTAEGGTPATAAQASAKDQAAKGAGAKSQEKK